MPKIRIITARPFISEGGRQYAKGEWEVSAALAKQFIEEERAVLVEETVKEVVTESKSVTPALPEKSEEAKAAAEESDIPENFPARDRLIAHGISSIEELKSAGIKERIDEIEGIGPKTMEAIGLAIIELP